MIRLIAATLVVSGFVATSLSSPRPYARLISIEVVQDGKVILVGSTSDNGRKDVDDVWRLVTRSAREHTYSTTLHATEHFKPEMLTKINGKQYVLRSQTKRNQPILRVRYGGQASVRELKLTRVEDTKRVSGVRPRNWRLDADQIKSLFSTRLISRRDAARIADIKDTDF